MLRLEPLREGVPTAVDPLGFYVTTSGGLPAPAPAEVAEAPGDGPAGSTPAAVQYRSGEEGLAEQFWVTHILCYVRLTQMIQQSIAREGGGGGWASDRDDALEATAPGGAAAVSSRAFETPAASQTLADTESLTAARQQVALAMRRCLRVHCGVPFEPLRRLTWPFFSGAGQRPAHRVRADHAVYQGLLASPARPEVVETIRRDLDRTFPAHCLFRGHRSIGQRGLRNILHAYSLYDPEVGYCQGMAFIVSVLLLHMPEEEAFWVLVHMMHGPQFRMRELYLPGFPLLQHFFERLRHVLRRLLPSLHRHFEDEGIDVAFFASQWFMTLFSYHFPIDVVCRLWDLFLSEGWRVLFQAALALLQWDQPHLLRLRMEDALLFLKESHEWKCGEELLRRVFAVPIDAKDLHWDSRATN